MLLMLLHRNNIMDVSTLFHIRDEHILSELIIDVTLLVEDQDSIDDKPIIITSVISNCFIPLNWNCLPFISLEQEVICMKHEME